MTEKSIFSKIIDKEIPSQIIYEDDIAIVIADINPVNAGHVLVISKEQFTDITETPNPVLADLMVIAKEIGAKMITLEGVKGFNIIINTKPEAGQVVFHTHIHVIPRYEGDSFEHWHGNQDAKDKQFDVCHKLREIL